MTDCESRMQKSLDMLLGKERQNTCQHMSLTKNLYLARKQCPHPLTTIPLSMTKSYLKHQVFGFQVLIQMLYQKKAIEQNEIEYLGPVRLLSQELAKPGTCNNLNTQDTFNLFNSQFILR